MVSSSFRERLHDAYNLINIMAGRAFILLQERENSHMFITLSTIGVIFI